MKPTESPWFCAAFGAGCLAFAVHSIFIGEMAAGKQGTSVIVRAQTPGFFWFAVLLVSALGAGMLWQAWRLWTSDEDA